MNDALNRVIISGHEGEELVAYRDTRGFLTIGRGFNLQAVGAPQVCAHLGIAYAEVRAGAPITEAQSAALFDLQYEAVAAQARTVFPEIDTYPDNAAAVITDMLFELGPRGFGAFRDAIAAFRSGDYAGAIAAIRSSELARQVPHRVDLNCSLLRAIQPAAVAAAV